MISAYMSIYEHMSIYERKSAGLKVKLIGVENSHRVIVIELLRGNRKIYNCWSLPSMFYKQ